MEQSARLEGYVVGALQCGGFEGPATKLPPPLIYLDKMLFGGFDLHNTRDAFGSFPFKVKEILQF